MRTADAITRTVPTLFARVFFVARCRTAAVIEIRFILCRIFASSNHVNHACQSIDRGIAFMSPPGQHSCTRRIRVMVKVTVKVSYA